jgi:hypothetical protein
MPDVFINYRTGDGDEAASLVEAYLSNRFGRERIFRAARSISPGDDFGRELLDAARSSSVLLAIMGPQWAQYPQLHDEADWVRREILEAFGSGSRVIPVLKGRSAERLSAAALPSELAWLADVQSLRLDTRDNEADLASIAGRLTDLVSALRESDRARQVPESGAVRNSARDVEGPVVQGRDFSGDIGGVVIKGNHGPIHGGKGNQYNYPRDDR